MGLVVLGPGGAVVEEGGLPQMQGWVLRSEWRNWETECIFILGRWGEWQQKVAPSIGLQGWKSLGHTVGICCIPGIVLSLPLGVHAPLGQVDTWDSVIHLPASGLGVCHGGAWV